MSDGHGSDGASSGGLGKPQDDTNAEGEEGHGQSGKGERSGSAPATPAVIPNPLKTGRESPSPKTDSDNAERIPEPTKAVEKAALIVSLVTGLIAAAGVWVSYGQLRANNIQAQVAKRQLDDAEAAASSALADKAAADARADRLITANEQLATAAADANRQTMHNFMLDQRPQIWAINAAQSPALHSSAEGEGQILWDWTIQNFGRSPAYDVQQTTYIKYGINPFMQTWGERAAKARQHAPGAPIPPNATVFGTIVGPPGVDAEAFKQMMATDAAVGMMVHVTYKDAFGKPHATEFCYMHLASGANVQCQGHNYAD